MNNSTFPEESQETVNEESVGKINAANDKELKIETINEEVFQYVETEMNEIISALENAHATKIDLAIEALELQERQVNDDTYRGFQQLQEKYTLRKEYFSVRKENQLELVQLMSDWLKHQTENDVIANSSEYRESIMTGTRRAVQQLYLERDSLDEYLNTLHPLHDELNFRRVMSNAHHNASTTYKSPSNSDDLGRVILGLNSINKGDEDQIKNLDKDIAQMTSKSKEAPNNNGVAHMRKIVGGKVKLSHYPYWIREAVSANKRRNKIIDLNRNNGTLNQLYEQDPYYVSSEINRIFSGGRIQLPPLITGLTTNEIDDDIGLITSLNPDNKAKVEEPEGISKDDMQNADDKKYDIDRLPYGEYDYSYYGPPNSSDYGAPYASDPYMSHYDPHYHSKPYEQQGYPYSLSKKPINRDSR